MRIQPRLVAPFLACLLCVGAMPARAAEPPDPTPAAAPAAPAAVQRDDETRMLGPDDAKFAVLVRAARGEVQGTVVLLPPGGSHTTTDTALQRLRHDLPMHGWNTWLLDLDAAPGIHIGRIDPDADHDDTAASAPGTDMEHWLVRSEARVELALDAARASHPTVVVAASGLTAALLLHALPSASAALLIDPLELPGLTLSWPQPLPAPVMEIVRPSLAVQRSPPEQASTDGGPVRYRRLVIDTTGVHVKASDVETLLTRRVRGWLKSTLTAPSGGAAVAD